MGKKIEFDFNDFELDEIPSESAIVESWDEDIDSPLVSILCVTYNHVQFIESAFRGFLCQQTTFPFEIVVHDDASDDGTTEIVKSYAERYPKIIKPIIQKHNQYSKGKFPTPLSLPYLLGKYVAMCEGDDFWLSKSKLQKQVELLEQNPKSVMSGHITYTFHMNNETLVDNQWTDKLLINQNWECDLVKLSKMHTSSLVLRKQELEESIEQLGDFPSSDAAIRFLMSIKGGVIYIPDAMSVYRKGVENSWTIRIRDIKYAESNFKSQMEFLNHLEVVAGVRNKKRIKKIKESQVFSMLYVLRIHNDFFGYGKLACNSVNLFNPKSFVKLFLLAAVGSKKYSLLLGNI